MDALPDELLSRILRLATATPSTFKQLYTYTGDPHSHHPPLRFPYDHVPANATKVALVCVSRRFWMLASEYLYEVVSPETPKQIEQFSTVLAKYSPLDGTPGIGRHVKYFLPSLGVENVRKKQRELYENLVSIFRRCPALRGVAFDITIEFFAGTMGLPVGRPPQIDMTTGELTGRRAKKTFRKYEKRIIQAIQPELLEHIHWHCEGTRFEDAMLPLLQRARSLRCLTLTGEIPTHCPPSLISLPMLSHLEAYCFSILRHWDMPSLKRLETKTILSEEEITAGLWHRVSPKLRFLSFSTDDPTSPTVHNMLLSLTRLDEVVFEFIPSRPRPLQSPFRLPHLSIRHIAVDFSAYALYYLSNSIYEDPLPEVIRIARGLRTHYIPWLVDQTVFPNLKSFTLKSLDSLALAFPEKTRETFVNGMNVVLNMCRVEVEGIACHGFELDAENDHADRMRRLEMDFDPDAEFDTT